MKMIARGMCVLVFVLLLICPSFTIAAPFNASEASNNLAFGDLPEEPSDFGTPGRFWFNATVDIGSNKIKGGHNCMEFFCWDEADAFVLEVPRGLEVSTINWTNKRRMRMKIFDSDTSLLFAQVNYHFSGTISKKMEAGLYDVIISNGIDYPTRDGGP